MGGGDLIVDCAVVKYQLMIAVKLMKKDILRKGKHSKYYEQAQKMVQVDALD